MSRNPGDPTVVDLFTPGGLLNQRTLHVILYGGPGVGKSTVAAGVFAKLKQTGVRVELITEYAKDLVWEGRLDQTWQPRIAMEQAWRMERLEGQVAVTISDGSPLNSLVYSDCTPELRDWILADYRNRRTVAFQLVRDPLRAYDTAGRSQTEVEAREVDRLVDAMLTSNRITRRVVSNPAGYRIARAIRDELRRG